MKKQLLLLAMILLPMVASAHDIEVKNADGVTIYYNYTNDNAELAVTYRGSSYTSYSNEYSGNVVIPEEVTYMNRTRKVTSIENEAFYDCTGLTSVTIPKSVKRIGDYAFQNCSGLTSITIPKSVTSIGYSAFQNCSGLTSVTIGNGVTSIGYGAFFGCSKLASVHISSIEAWCKISFSDGDANPLCYAKHLYLGEEEIKDLVIPNSVTSIGYSAFQNCSGLTSVTIPNSVTSIGYYAFCNCSGLTSVTIPNSVTSIGNGAFAGCIGLTSVTIPNSVTSIGDDMFYKCSGLTSVTIPNSVTSIGYRAFRECSGLTSVTIPNSVTSIGNGAFDGADIPTVISLIENPFKINGKSLNTRIFSQNTFNNATLYVPKGTINKYKATEGWKDFLFIEEGTGGGETPTDPVEINGINYNLIAEGHTAEVTSNPQKYSGDIVIPPSVTYQGLDYSVTSIGKYAFYYCSGLTSVTIPNSVTKIGQSAFGGCDGLTSVTIGNSVTSIGVHAFSGCSGLTSITIPNSVTSIEFGAFFACIGLTSVIIGNGIKEIGSSFTCCTKLTDVYCYAESVPTTNSNAFSDSPVGNATLHVPASAVDAYKAATPWRNFKEIVALTNDDPQPMGIVEINGVYYKLITNSNIAKVTSNPQKYSGVIVIPPSVTYQGLDYSVTSIGDWAFYGCIGLTSVTIGNSVTSIGNYAFWYCSRLTSVIIGNGVTSIGYAAFSSCPGLTSITVEEGNSKYDSRDNCNAIIETGTNTLIAGCKNTVIPNSVTNIGENAFYNCSGLTSVTIPNSVTSIGKSAFYGCSGLTSVTIPNSVTSIGKAAFEGCSKLTSITIPNSVASIGDRAFWGCSGLTSVIIGNGIKEVNGWVFVDCTNLTDVYCYAESVPTTGSNAFFNSPVGNATLHVPASAVDAYKAADPWSNFKEIVALTNDDPGPMGIEEINGIYYNLITNGNIAEVTRNPQKYSGDIVIPPSVTYQGLDYSVTSIGNDAFYKCSGLTSVTIPNSVTSIGNNAFYQCRGLTSVTIGNSVTRIGDFAFSECIGLTSVTIPNSVTSIGEYAFHYCRGLTSITIPNSVTRIESSAFRDCSGLTSVTIPNSVTSLGNRAFYGVDIPTVISLIENPFKIVSKSSDHRTFSQNTFNNATLYVPKGTIDKYKATDGWKDFANIKEGNPTAINVVENAKDCKAVIYDLNGVRQSEPKKGINIINGKKYVKK